MFLGHFGAGFYGSAFTRRPALGTLFFAAQFIDLLWPLLLIAGVEHVAIDPGNTAVTPLHFEHYPWTHSGLMVAIWGVLFGAVYYLFRKDVRAALVLGALVFSHWLLDVLVHAPDLPLFPWGGPVVGLGLWDSLPATMVLEFGILAAGVWYYVAHTRAKTKTGTYALWSLVLFLALVYLGNVFGPAPDNVDAIGYVGLSQWLLIAWGYWIGNKREWLGAKAHSSTM